MYFLLTTRRNTLRRVELEGHRLFTPAGRPIVGLFAKKVVLTNAL